MSDGMFLMFAAGTLVLFVLVGLAWPRNERNPHVDARRNWWQRNPK